MEASIWHRRRCGVAILILVAGAASSHADPAREASGRARDRILFRTKLGAAALRAVLIEAAQRLAESECAMIFSDFADASGRKLQENLDALEQTGPGHLKLLMFADGYGFARCIDPTILAMTAPGSRAIRVCPQFAEARLRAPATARAILIHEVLHSRGLQENPPSSSER